MIGDKFFATSTADPAVELEVEHHFNLCAIVRVNGEARTLSALLHREAIDDLLLFLSSPVYGEVRTLPDAILPGVDSVLASRIDGALVIAVWSAPRLPITVALADDRARELVPFLRGIVG